MSRARGFLVSRCSPIVSIVGLLALIVSSSAAQPCTGDCNGDGGVAVDEIIVGVNMALSLLPLTDCQTFDRNGSSDVQIDELITAVDLALRGCAAPPPTVTASPESTTTPTFTEPPPTALPTATPTNVGGCGSLEPPTSFGEAFVDLTTDVEADLVPIVVPPPNLDRGKSVAFFNDIDGDGIMEVFVGQDARTVVTLLRYDPSTEKLVRDTAAVLPVFDWFFGVIDVDSDGIPDLFGEYAARPRVAFGRGNGTFEEPADVFPEPSLLTFYLGPYFDDFDGDGWLDFVVYGAVGCDTQERSIRVLFAEGNRRWSRRDDVLPSDLRIADGLVFTAPLLGVEQTAVVLGGDCGQPAVPAPRFFVPQPEASGLPTWAPAGVLGAIGEARLPYPLLAPMGAAVGDLDGDGRFELSISGNPILGFWRGVDTAPMPDVTNLTRMGTDMGDRGILMIPWSVLFIDLDRDGRLDTFVTHGDDFTAQQSQQIGPQWSTAYWNGGGLCGYEISDGLNITRRGDWRTLAVGDLEGDGLPDLAVGGHGEQPRILHNRIDTGNHGFGLRLRGTTSNRYGIGARVEVSVVDGAPAQLHLVGGFYPVATVVEPLVFVGLGAAAAATSVRITWPAGTVQELRDVRAGALHTIEEPPTITIEPAARHIAAGSNDVATVRVTPRDLAGAVRADAEVEVAITTGEAKLSAPAAWNGSEWQAQVMPPGVAGSSVIEVTIDGKPLGIRPRIWFD